MTYVIFSVVFVETFLFGQIFVILQPSQSMLNIHCMIKHDAVKVSCVFYNYVA